MLATAVDQLFNGFIGYNLTEFEQQQQQQQQQKQQSINNGTDNQFGIKTIESDSIKQRKLSSRNGSRIQPMFIGIGETMPIEYINTTISTETCTATDLANDSIIIDHDYAINPTLYTMVTSNIDQNNNDDLNIKHNQLSSPQPSSSDNSDIGYESMSSPEPIQSTPKIDNVKIATTAQQFNLFALDDDQKNNNHDDEEVDDYWPSLDDEIRYMSFWANFFRNYIHHQNQNSNHDPPQYSMITMMELCENFHNRLFGLLKFRIRLLLSSSGGHNDDGEKQHQQQKQPQSSSMKEAIELLSILLKSKQDQWNLLQKKMNPSLLPSLPRIEN